MATRNLTVDLDDPASCAANADWWQHLTVAGGEGMVVKPATTVHHSRGVPRPSIKIRGQDHLRIVYGSEHTAEANLTRFRPGIGRPA